MPLKTSISEELPSVNLTPMIDVVFLLIIFFMVGTKFTDPERQIGIKLPAVAPPGAMISPPLRKQVSVTKDGNIFLDQRRLSPDQLTGELKAVRGEYPGIGVVVNGDREAIHGRVTEVLDAIARAGITDLSIGVGINQSLMR